MATIGGDVAQINVQEGDTVAQDQVLVVLTSEELDNQIANSADAVRNAELALEGQVDQMGDYVITSPISGTIIEKNYKAGDNAGKRQDFVHGLRPLLLKNDHECG